MMKRDAGDGSTCTQPLRGNEQPFSFFIAVGIVVGLFLALDNLFGILLIAAFAPLLPT